MILCLKWACLKPGSPACKRRHPAAACAGCEARILKRCGQSCPHWRAAPQHRQCKAPGSHRPAAAGAIRAAGHDKAHANARTWQEAQSSRINRGSGCGLMLRPATLTHNRPSGLAPIPCSAPSFSPIACSQPPPSTSSSPQLAWARARARLAPSNTNGWPGRPCWRIRCARSRRCWQTARWRRSGWWWRRRTSGWPMRCPMWRAGPRCCAAAAPAARPLWPTAWRLCRPPACPRSPGCWCTTPRVACCRPARCAH